MSTLQPMPDGVISRAALRKKLEKGPVKVYWITRGTIGGSFVDYQIKNVTLIDDNGWFFVHEGQRIHLFTNYWYAHAFVCQNMALDTSKAVK